MIMNSDCCHRNVINIQRSAITMGFVSKPTIHNTSIEIMGIHLYTTKMSYYNVSNLFRIFYPNTKIPILSISNIYSFNFHVELIFDFRSASANIRKSTTFKIWKSIYMIATGFPRAVRSRSFFHNRFIRHAINLFSSFEIK